MELAVALTSERDPDRLFVQLCRRGRELLASKYALVGVLNEAGTDFSHHVAAGVDPENRARLLPKSPAAGIFGRVMRERAPLRLAGPPAAAEALRLLSDLPQLESLLVVPIMTPSKVYGWLCLADRLGIEQFTGSDEQIARSLARAAAVTYATILGAPPSERLPWASSPETASAAPGVTTIVIVDERRIVREGVRALLEREPGLRVVGDVGDGLEAIRMVERLRPDILIVDVAMPGLGGLDVIRELRKQSHDTKVIVLSMYSDERYVREAIGSGALGYVLKTSGSRELIEAIRLAASGRRYLSPPLTERAIAVYAKGVAAGELDPYELLTTREREVLRLVAEGCSNKEMGARLFISPRTVEAHRFKLKRKLGLRTHSDIVQYALRRGLLSPSG
ncbi:MAG: hypothetical protein QOD06_1906 [Candidatus Binatota bacterium]|nr:hypothetical protein [Candidatus Binatota bacterium]